MNNNSFVEKNMSVGKLILSLLMLLIVVVGGTFAWLTYSSKESALVLTIGDINDTQIKLSPYQVTGSITPGTSHTSGVYSEVEVTKGNNNSTSFSLFYKINDLDVKLINKGLSYTIVNTKGTESTGDDVTVKTGKFSDLIDTSKPLPKEVIILDTNTDSSLSANTSTYYRVYLWVDSNVGNQSDIQNSNLNVELNGSIGSVKITGYSVYGHTLTVNVNDTVIDNSTSYSYQWYSSSTSTTKNGTAISGATSSSYTVGSGLVGKYIYVVVTTSKGKTLSDVTDSGNNYDISQECDNFNDGRVEKTTPVLTLSATSGTVEAGSNAQFTTSVNKSSSYVGANYTGKQTAVSEDTNNVTVTAGNEVGMTIGVSSAGSSTIKYHGMETKEAKSNITVTFTPNDTANICPVSTSYEVDKTDNTVPTTPGLTLIDCDTFTYSSTDIVGVTGYYISTSSTKPSATADGWVSATTTTKDITIGTSAQTYYVWAKDADGNVSASSNTALVKITRTQGAGTTLTTRYNSTSISTGTEYTSSIYILKNCPIYSSAIANSGYNDIVLNHNGTSVLPAGATATVTAAFSVESRATQNVAEITLNKDGSAWSNSGINVALYSGTTATSHTYANATKSGATVSWNGVVPGTYNVYASKNSGAKTSLVDTGIDVTIGSSTEATASYGASINYYTLTLNNGSTDAISKVAAVTDGSTTSNNASSVSVVYLNNQTASISATMKDSGWTFSKWTVNAGNTPASTTASSTTVSMSKKTTLTATGADITAPLCSLSSTSTLKSAQQTVTASISQGGGTVLSKYYWGTSSTGTPGTASSASSLELIAKDTGGVWYLRVQDAAGNIGACSVTMVSYTVQNRLLTTSGVESFNNNPTAFNTTNYAESSTHTYLIPNGTNVSRSGSLTVPTGGNGSSYAASIYENISDIPSSGAASVVEAPVITTTNDVLVLWINRLKYTITVTKPTNGTVKAETVSQKNNSVTASTADASLTVRYGDTVKATATAATGYHFSGWSGGYLSGNINGSIGGEVTDANTITGSFAANELVFEGSQEFTVTYSESQQSVTYTPASNGTGTYTYTISGTGSSYFSASGSTLTIAASTPAGKYTLTVLAKDSKSAVTKTSTFVVNVNQAKTATTGSCATLTYNGSSQTLASGGKYISYSNNSGTNASSYTVTVTSDANHQFSDGTESKTLSCSISQKKLTVANFTYSPLTKTYDGTTGAPSGFGVTATASSGLVSGDAVSVGFTGASYNNANVASANTITVSGMTISGTDAANYSLSATSYAKTGATITNATLSGGSVIISGTNTWGQTLTATVNNTSPTATYAYQWWYSTTSGATSGTAISGATSSTYTIDKAYVGKYIGCTVTASKTNYSNKTFSVVTTTTVAKQNLRVVGSPTFVGVYDGSEHYATIKVDSSDWDGKTIVSGTSTSYGTTVTSSGVYNTSYNLKPGYTDFTNGAKTVYYKVTGGTYYNDKTGSVTVSITAKQLDVSKFTYSPLTKTYDGTTGAPSGFGVTATTSSGLVSGDVVSVGFTGASYNNASVASANTITVSGMTISGTDAGNYSLSATSYAKTGATITKVPNPITVTTPQTWSTTFSTSAQTKAITAATGAQGNVTYSIQSQKNASGTAVTYFSISGTTLSMAANTPVSGSDYTVVIRATAAGNDSYDSGYKDITMTVTVGKAPNPITVTTPQTWATTFSTSAQTKDLTSAVTGAQGDVTYSILSQKITNSLDIKFFSISGTTLTMKESTPIPLNNLSYTVIIRATTLGNNNYSSGYKDITMTVTVGKAPNPITVTTPQTWSTTFSTSAQTKDITAATGAQGDVTYSILSQANVDGIGTTFFSISGTTLTMKESTPVSGSIYTVVIRATAAGNNNYNSGYKDIKMRVTVNKAPNPIAVTTPLTWSTIFSSSEQTKSITAATGAQGDVTYSIQSQKNAGGTAVTYFSISGTTLSMAANTPVSGSDYTVVIRATAAGNDNYDSGYKDITMTVTVGKAPNPITVTKLQTWSTTFSTSAQGKDLTSAATDAQGDVTYTIVSQKNVNGIGTTFFSISGTILAMKESTPVSGSDYKVVIRATAAGNDNYNSGYKDMTMRVTVGKGSNPIAVTTPQTWSTTFSTSAQTKSITAATGAQGDVTYSIQSQKNAGGTAVTYFSISGTTLTMKESTPVSGSNYTVVIRATAAGNNNYSSGYKDITMRVTVNKAPNSIAVTTPQTWSTTFSTSAQTKALTSTATDAQGDVTYSIVSQKNVNGIGTTFFSISGTTLTMKESTPVSGSDYTVVIRATAAGNDNYNTGYKDMTMRVTVIKADFSISPTIHGTNLVGDELSVDIELPDGYPDESDVVYTYQWYRNDNASETSTSNAEAVTDITTDNTYTVTSEDVGKYMFVIVRASADNYNDAINSDITDGDINDFPNVHREIGGRFYYYDSSIDDINAKIVSCYTTGTRCNVSLPPFVSSSKGRYGGDNVGASSSTDSMVVASKYTLTDDGNIDNDKYYAIYSKEVTLYRPTSVSVCSSKTLYRNEFFTSNGTMYSIVGPNSNSLDIDDTPFYSTAIDNRSDILEQVNIAESTVTTYYGWYRYITEITYNVNGGTGTVSKTNGYFERYCTSNTAATESGKTTISSTEPTRADYNFMGWATSSTATSATYFKGKNYSIMTKHGTLSGNLLTLNLYAVWKKPCKITYYNGTTSLGTTEFKCGMPTTLKKFGSGGFGASPSYSSYGWSFDGWSTDSTSVTKSVDDGASVSFDGDTSLYAIYYRPVHFFSGIDGDGTLDVDDDGLPTELYHDGTLPQYYSSYSKTASSMTAPKIGSPIKDWQNSGYRNDDLAGSYEYRASTSTLRTITPAYGGSNILYAVYTRPFPLEYYANGSLFKTQTLNFSYLNSANKAGNSLPIVDFTVISDIPTTTGYTFTGWHPDPDFTKVDGTNGKYGITLTDNLVYTKDNRFTSNNTSDSYPSDPWSSLPYNAFPYGAKFIAEFKTPITYTIAYNYNGGTKGTYAPTSGAYGSVVQISNPTKTNYVFTGWTFNGDISTAKYGTSATNVTSPWASTSTKVNAMYFENLTATSGATVTLTANWSANSYAIAYEPNGGTLGEYAPESGVYNNSVRISNPTRTGYKFTGWTFNGNTSTAKYGESSNVDDITDSWSNRSTKVNAEYFKNLIATGSKVTMTANWEAITYRITYDLGSVCTLGTNSPYEATYDEIIQISNPTCSGYRFDGWTFDGNHLTARHGTSNTNVEMLWEGTVTSTYFKNLESDNNSEVELVANVTNLDLTAPTVTFTTNGTSTYTTTKGTVVTVDDTSGVKTLKYIWSKTSSDSAINGKTFTSGSLITNPDDTGEYYLIIYAMDQVGNYIDKPSNIFHLDNTAPTVDIDTYTGNTVSTSAGNTYNGSWTKNAVLALVRYSDAESGINTNAVSYKVAGQSSYTAVPNPGSDRTNFRFGQAATTSIPNAVKVETASTGYSYFKVCDKAGNCAEEPFTLRQDFTAPIASCSPNGYVGASSHASKIVTFSVTDSLSGVNFVGASWYKVMDTQASPQSGTYIVRQVTSITIPLKTTKQYINYRVCDKVGNCEAYGCEGAFYKTS